jgi:hypothetical protein
MAKIFATNKLKILRNKSTTIALVLILTLSATFVALSVVQAQPPPPFEIPDRIRTFAFLSAAPDPVGIGQTIWFNMFLHMPAPTVNYLRGIDVWKGYTITVTKPDDTTVTLGPFQADATGGTYTTYVADQLGEWNFKFEFPGQALTSPGPWEGTYFEPSSATASLTVQQEAVVPYPSYPPTTDYWERPIYAMNYEWWKIGGNWLGLAPSTFHTTGQYNASGNFAPYTTAPKSPHIVWTRPMKFGGQIGGYPFGGDETTQFVSTSQYQPLYGPIIIAGRLYWQERPGSSRNPTGWNCVDLRTGELIWHKNITDDLLLGQILEYESINQYGAYAYLWSTRPTVPPNTGGTLGMYDAWTGNWICDIVNATAVGQFGMGLNWMLDDRTCKGSLLGYWVDSMAGTLNMWNSTWGILAGGPSPFGPPGTVSGDPHGQWWGPPQGSQIDFKYGIVWSKPIPTTLNNKSISLSISRMTPDIILLTQQASAMFNPQAGWYYAAAMSARDGRLLWGPYNYTAPPFTYLEIWTPAIEEVWTTYDRDTFEFNGYSLLTGQKIWGPVTPPHNVWDKYGMATIGGYGNIYAMGFGGNVHCIDIKTGTIEWSYNTGGGGYDSPFGVWTIWTFSRQTLADGKLYFGQGHEYSPPLYRGCREICLDAFTGEELWSVLGFYAEGPPAIADGYMVVDNAYDMQLYCFSKGQTATTVTAPQTAVPARTGVLIQGTVTDQSPGQTCLGIPAAGTPAIADAYMKPWMEYLYMQQPMPQNATGVPVMVQAMDSAGNMINIGTVTSDAFGNFECVFYPEEEGVYKILASFLGSDSYYASYASTGVAVCPEPEEIVIPEPPEPEPAADYTPMFLAIIAAVVIVAILVVIDIVLARRK